MRVELEEINCRIYGRMEFEDDSGLIFQVVNRLRK